MDERDTLTPDEAQRRLDLGTSTSLTSAGDRRLHAGSTALFGVGLGAMAVTSSRLDGLVGSAVSGILAAALLGLLLWADSRARTVPRRARLISRVGVGVSLVVGLVAVLPWLNLRAQDQVIGWPLALAAVAVIALPSLVAAAAIGRRA